MAQRTAEIAARPLAALRVIEEKYPRLWKDAARITPRDWPLYCYMPMSGWLALIGLDGFRALPLVSALGSWRLGKGVYTFDDDLARALIDTPLPDTAPTEVFFRLPEYGVYIDTPWRAEHSGVLTHLEYDVDRKHSELRLLYLPREGDVINGAAPYMLHIDRRDVVSAMRETYGGLTDKILPYIRDELSLILYLCSDTPDYGDRTPPTYATPKKVKGGWKWIPKQTPEEWRVGVRLGAALKKYREDRAQAEPHEPTGRTVRPHIRRAHWHGYWTGPRAETQRFIHRWIPPTAVNARSEEMPAVVRKVEKD